MTDLQGSEQCEEERRLSVADAPETPWREWGTYLPERQWGTVREDLSDSGDCWNSFPYEQAQYRAYRWGEDGLLGWTDSKCRLAFAASLWNGQDAVLKERLFGLSNPEGNHGEDVKELYYYLDATPTHSYAKALYKYPQHAFPYQDLRDQNKKRGFSDKEYELLDTGVFDEDRYFDVTVEYAKAAPEDMLIRLTVSNRGPDAATLTVLPTLTLRNTWSYPVEPEDAAKPTLKAGPEGSILIEHASLGSYVLSPVDADRVQFLNTIFTENENNQIRLDPAFSGAPPGCCKDAFDRYIVHGEQGAPNTSGSGTKAALHYFLTIHPRQSQVLTFRLAKVHDAQTEALAPIDVSACFAQRIAEADAFYAKHIPEAASEDEKNISRQAFAGLLWSRQFYYYVGRNWLTPERNNQPDAKPKESEREWSHLYCQDVLSIPDKWEYPWFAAWDLAFHMVPMATIDPAFAKAQLLLLLREWYLHPNGQMPAYEFNFSDVNPPVHAWAVWHIYQATAEASGGDLDFLERAFQKLLLNFTWWVNRNDAQGRNLFGGGFLGLDNIGVFDRSQLPEGIGLDQADATAWMGLYCSCMLQMAVELAQTRPAYEDIASKFFEHYIAVIHALNSLDGNGLWDDEEGFYFDRMTSKDVDAKVLKLRSLVGLMPLSGVCVIRKQVLEKLPGLARRSIWFRDHRPQLASLVTVAETTEPSLEGALCLSLVPKDRLIRMLSKVLDETEFLSPFGIRSLSKFHEKHPFALDFGGKSYCVEYSHAEGLNSMFGGNSNWRGPVWFPVNALFCLALDQYQVVYGDSLRVECPTGSGHWMTCREVSTELNRRLSAIFLRGETGSRPCHDGEARYAGDPYWRDLLLFHEYFSGDNGRGVGASHQTGWTALISTAIERRYADTRTSLQSI